MSQRACSALFIAMSLVAAPMAHAGSAGVLGPGCYLWTLSYSGTDPFVQTATPRPGGVYAVYLWLFPGVHPDGVTSADLTVRPSPEYVYLGFTPENGFLNAGSIAHPLLSVAGCPAGPIRAASLLMLELPDPGASICLGDPSGGNGPIVVTDCAAPIPQQLPGAYLGCSIAGAPCEFEHPCTVSTQPSSWGSVKAIYR